MRYTTTRGALANVSFERVLFSGFAPDGGLYMPENIPRLEPETLREWSGFSYPRLVKEICALYISREELSRACIDDLIDAAFSRFPQEEVVSMARLGAGLNVLELWYGITHTFKDLAMSCVAQLLQHFLSKKNQHVTVLVGTSGDTGSSAIESVRGVKAIDIVVLFPRGLCSKIQEQQMTTVIEDNVHIFAVDGTADELDVPIRKLFADEKFVWSHRLISLNSINWARVMVQIAHFFYAYFHCLPVVVGVPQSPLVEVVVPTGGAGNITAGTVAQMMGLPIRLVTVVNENDIVHRTVQNGDYSLAKTTKASLAPAIDIQEPYNLERIFWLFSGMDSSQIKGMMEEFQRLGRVEVPDTLHRKMLAALVSSSVTDADITQTMVRCWEENHYLLCPHSAVAITHHYRQVDLGNNRVHRCCLATASAAKFQEAVLKAGLTPEIPPAIRALETMETRYATMKRGEDWEQMLRATVEEITALRNH
eukprot:gi/632960499/ref/XP_007896229.1/ PREDICTED: threonine synthase-like 2 [Callorhinchus milii]